MMIKTKSKKLNVPYIGYRLQALSLSIKQNNYHYIRGIFNGREK